MCIRDRYQRRVRGWRERMSTKARRAVLKDFKAISRDPPPGVTGAPSENDVMKWWCKIEGPADTPWQGALLNLTINFTEEYPMKPPEVLFVTPMYHPNIYENGAICLDILQNKWSPSYDISAVLTSIQSLLNDPNPDSPANSQAAREFVANRLLYTQKVMECVENSWAAKVGL
eukprot:TRINITY_DN1020_c0_g1_i1.p1 TRINITY_DN1020_c0_g1~~TRINITY_DN1020_c0_g1_i1.p1  ORF type:complete len:173 (-),score=50.91 TRINITY_DN1020_c0_g1_i1:633-1151(-)